MKRRSTYKPPEWSEARKDRLALTLAVCLYIGILALIGWG